MRSELNETSGHVIGAAIDVHRELGPGLLERAYETCLAHELISRGITVQQQVSLPVRYRDLSVDLGYRLDLLVEGHVVVEVKAVQSLHPVHMAQLLSYLKLSGCKLGLLINFNCCLLREGIRRVVH